MRPRLLLPLILLGLLLGWPVAARGEVTGGDKSRAKELLRQGNKFHRTGNYEAALKLFREAHAHYPSYKIRFNIAATLYAMGRHVDAARELRTFLSSAGEVAPKEAVAAARIQLKEVLSKIGVIEVTCEVPGATVMLGGKLQGQTPLESPIYLRPGTYQLVVTKLGYGTYAVSATLEPGDHQRYQVPWKVGGGGGSGEPVPDPGTGAGGQGSGPRFRKSVLGYVSLGAGGALTVAAAVMYGLGASQGSAAHEDYRAATEETEILLHRDEVESARNKLIVGHVLMGVAAVAYGVAIYALVTRPDERPAASAASAPTPPALDVAVLPGGAAVSLGGTF